MQSVSALRLLTGVLLLEGALLLGLGVVYGAASIGDDSDRAPALTAAAFALAIGLVLVFLARAVSRGQGWARGPAVALNLFPVVLGGSLLGQGVWWVALPLLALGALVLVLFTRPELRERFREE